MTHAPTVMGPCGKAWERKFNAKDHENGPACLSYWLMYCPGAHPCWDYHLLTLIHLRDLPGMPSAKIAVPGATHEVFVQALNPDVEDIVGLFHDEARPGMPYMVPADAIVQFQADADTTAMRISLLCANAVVSGHLVPDSDHQSCWTKAIVETLEHIKQDLH